MTSMPRVGGRRGFTLIEIVVTLGIIALVSTVAVPAMLREPDRTDIDLAVDEVRGVLELARSSAVRTSAPVRVAVDSVSGSIWFIPTDPGSETGVTLAAVALPQGVELQTSEARAEFVFHPEGFAFPDSVFLSGMGGAALVTVDALNGHVLVVR